jgi:hypothetical protein
MEILLQVSACYFKSYYYKMIYFKLFVKYIDASSGIVWMVWRELNERNQQKV